MAGNQTMPEGFGDTGLERADNGGNGLAQIPVYLRVHTVEQSGKNEGASADIATRR